VSQFLPALLAQLFGFVCHMGLPILIRWRRIHHSRRACGIVAACSSLMREGHVLRHIDTTLNTDGPDRIANSASAACPKGSQNGKRQSPFWRTK
jgi:hypothetical protein